jgi:hypothetical protein
METLSRQRVASSVVLSQLRLMAVSPEKQRLMASNSKCQRASAQVRGCTWTLLEDSGQCHGSLVLGDRSPRLLIAARVAAPRLCV